MFRGRGLLLGGGSRASCGIGWPRESRYLILKLHLFLCVLLPGVLFISPLGFSFSFGQAKIFAFFFGALGGLRGVWVVKEKDEHVREQHNTQDHHGCDWEF